MSNSKDLEQIASVERGAELRERWLEYAKKGGGIALKSAGVVLGVGLMVFGAAEAAWAIVDQVGFILTGGVVPAHELADAVRNGLSPDWAGPVGDVVGAGVGGVAELSGTAHNWFVNQNELVAGAVVTNYLAGAIGATVAAEVGPIVISESLDA